MSPKHISYIAGICLLLIMSTQSYLVYDYYQTTRASLVRESDAILQEAFRKDLSIRNQEYKHSVGEDTLKTAPPSTKKIQHQQVSNLQTNIETTSRCSWI